MEKSSAGASVRPAPPDLPLAGNAARGIAFMIGATLMFSLGDTLMKLAAGSLPTTETMFVRSLVATIFVAIPAWFSGALRQWQRALTGAMAIRAGSDVGASLLFQSALARMHFADLIGVSQLQTLSLTVGSALFLGETIGWRRWTAVGVGLVGGLLIIKPGTSAFNWWAIAALGTVMLATAREIATRKIPQLAPVTVIMLISSLSVTVVSIAGSLVQQWAMPGRLELAMMAGAGVFSACGQFCVISSVRTAEISVVAPFRYFAMTWALLLGFGVWRHVPDGWSLIGIFAISAAGMYTFRRERQLQAARSIRAN